ncbi:MAG: response regulator, partial [Bacteroidales bacterium]|nr:response regulator [Bacteroidales bacterium]
EYHPLDILVAEDNAINQRIIMSVLNRYGYHVKMVENGKEALESLERRLYDVVLMDIQMPVLDGIKATKLIRERFNSNRQPYIIALTADALQQSRTEYLTHGMDEVLYKPVQTKALMQLLANCQRLDRSKRGN